jgi:hypothetical protein
MGPSIVSRSFASLVVSLVLVTLGCSSSGKNKDGSVKTAEGGSNAGGDTRVPDVAMMPPTPDAGPTGAGGSGGAGGGGPPPADAAPPADARTPDVAAPAERPPADAAPPRPDTAPDRTPDTTPDTGGGQADAPADAPPPSPDATPDTTADSGPCAGLAEGAECNDGNPCTMADTCKAGVCAGVALVCAAQDSCHDVGVCDPATGMCSNPAKADGATCDDGNLCTTGDTCKAGTCSGGVAVVCNAPNMCTTASCDPKNGMCVVANKPDGSLCSDNNMCTTIDRCVNGACTGSQPLNCPPPASPCMNAACNPATGCGSTPKPIGTPCTCGLECIGVCNALGNCVQPA